jgi:hypothetical protein
MLLRYVLHPMVFFATREASVISSSVAPNSPCRLRVEVGAVAAAGRAETPSPISSLYFGGMAVWSESWRFLKLA